jgi:hypothetical protein
MNTSVHARRLRQILFALVLLITFEGLLRKMAPSELRLPIFLLKDVFVLALAFYVVRMPVSETLRSLWVAYVALAVLMLPLIVMTAYHDPLLSIFGAKQYLLYPFVGFATFTAFENAPMETVLRFFRWVSLLLIPTTILALVQSRLPSDHWLNMSVKGESLTAFSAEGELRVSSTFSFAAQYCAFLNAQMFIVWIAFQGWSKRNLAWKIIVPSLIPLIVISSYVTGSRSAVVGNLAIVIMAIGFVALKFRLGNLIHIGVAILVLYLTVLAVNHFAPKETKAYSAREQGHLVGFSSEIKERVYSSFFQVSNDRSLHTFLGNGLGVMSNGSDTFSTYAAIMRYRNYWTESDFPTTLFEGGYYLAVIWYGFRLFVILKTFGNFLFYVTPEYVVSMGFCQGFITVSGAVATLALQPPVAIWWWLAVGTSVLFSWKCIAPPDSEEKPQDPLPQAPVKTPRGRSLYADVIHTPGK